MGREDQRILACLKGDDKKLVARRAFRCKNPGRNVMDTWIPSNGDFNRRRGSLWKRYLIWLIPIPATAMQMKTTNPMKNKQRSSRRNPSHPAQDKNANHDLV